MDAGEGRHIRSPGTGTCLSSASCGEPNMPSTIVYAIQCMPRWTLPSPLFSLLCSNLFKTQLAVTQATSPAPSRQYSIFACLRLRHLKVRLSAFTLMVPCLRLAAVRYPFKDLCTGTFATINQAREKKRLDLNRSLDTPADRPLIQARGLLQPLAVLAQLDPPKLPPWFG